MDNSLQSDRGAKGVPRRTACKPAFRRSGAELAAQFDMRFRGLAIDASYSHGLPVMPRTRNNAAEDAVGERPALPGNRTRGVPPTTVILFESFLACAPIGAALLARGRSVHAVRFGLNLVAALDRTGAESVIISHGVGGELARELAAFVQVDRPDLVLLRAHPERWELDQDEELRRLVDDLPRGFGG